MTLVTIIGDFHSSILPIYYQFKDNIRTHIIIYDDFKSDIEEANNILIGIKKFNKKYNLNINTYSHIIDEDSYKALEKTVKFINKHIQ